MGMATAKLGKYGLQGFDALMQCFFSCRGISQKCHETLFFTFTWKWTWAAGSCDQFTWSKMFFLGYIHNSKQKHTQFLQILQVQIFRITACALYMVQCKCLQWRSQIVGIVENWYKSPCTWCTTKLHPDTGRTVGPSPSFCRWRSIPSGSPPHSLKVQNKQCSQRWSTRFTASSCPSVNKCPERFFFFFSKSLNIGTKLRDVRGQPSRPELNLWNVKYASDDWRVPTVQCYKHEKKKKSVSLSILHVDQIQNVRHRT